MTRLLATALLTTTLFLGCAPKTETTMAPPPAAPTTEPQLAADVGERVKDLAAHAQEYAANAAKLPSADEQTNRALLGTQFDLLAQILPPLNGPQMPGDFRQQLRIIASTRAQLANDSLDLSVEPAIDTGLRAAHHALASIAQRNFADLPDVAKTLDAMRARVDELDAATGYTHKAVAAQAVQISAQAINQMTTALEQRLK